MQFDAVIVTPDSEETLLAIGDAVGGVSEGRFPERVNDFDTPGFGI
jgi:hypothetical protein